MSGRFPWEGDFDATLSRFQPQLWEAPSLAPAGPWRAYWAASAWPGRQNANGLVFVCKRADAGEAPVLCVKVFADGDWAFLDGGPAEPEDIAMVHLHHVLERDPHPRVGA